MMQRLSRRHFLQTAGASLSALVVAACAVPGAPGAASGGSSSGAQEAIKLQMWGDFTKGPDTEIMASFMKANPGIEIEGLNVPQSPEKLVTAVTSGQPPSIFSMDRYLAGEWAARGVILSLEDYVNASTTFKKERLYERLRNDVTWHGAMWAMPRWTDCRVFWWNKAIYKEKGLDPEKAPTTWEELENYADAITEKDNTGLIKYLGYSPIAGNPPGFLQFWVYLWQLGGQFLSEDYSKPTFNGPEGVGALTWMVHMTDKYGGVDTISEFLQSPGNNQEQDVFSLGFLGQMIHGQWQVASYKRYAPDLDYGLATFPLPPNGKAVNYIGGWTYVIPKGVPHPDAAWKYIEYSMQDEQYKKTVDFQGVIPAFEDMAFSDWWLSQDPRRKLFAEEVKNGRWVPVTPGVAEIFSIQIRLLDEALHHQKSPQEALDAAAADVQKILDDNKDLREGKS